MNSRRRLQPLRNPARMKSRRTTTQPRTTIRTFSFSSPIFSELFLLALACVCARGARPSSCKLPVTDSSVGWRAERAAPQTFRTSIALACLCGHRLCWRDDRFGAQLVLRSDPVLDVHSRIFAALNVQLVSSLSNIFPGYFFVFDHCNLLDRRHGGGFRPRARDMPKLLGACCDADLDLLRLGFFTLGHMQGQHSVAIFGSNVLRADCVRQGKAPHERAVGAFDSEAVVFLDVLLEFPFATDGQCIVDDADVDILVAKVRKVGFHDQLVRGLVNVYGWRPGCQLCMTRAVAGKTVFEQTIHLVL